jgi:hypothetical protein
MPEHETIAGALVGILADLPGIEKKRHPGGVTYAYRGIEEITVALQPLLVKHGVVITPSATLVSVVPLPEKGNNANWTRTTLSVRYEIHLAGSKESPIRATCIGVGDDNADKGANKSMTQAFKYLLLQTFCIADPSDDGDSIPNDAPSGVRGPENTEQDETPPPVPEGWTNHDVCTAAHDALNTRVKALSDDQKAKCSEIRQGFTPNEDGKRWPLSLTDYEKLAAFVTACEAFGPDAGPDTSGADAVPEAAGAEAERF